MASEQTTPSLCCSRRASQRDIGSGRGDHSVVLAGWQLLVLWIITVDHSLWFAGMRPDGRWGSDHNSVSAITKEIVLIRNNIKVFNYTLGKTIDLLIKSYKNILVILGEETLISFT